MARGFVGMDQLIADLQGLNRGVVADCALPALEKGGAEAKTLAQARTPVRTGEARDSIYTSSAETQGSSAVMAIGSMLWRFHFIENGAPRMPAYRPIGNAVENVADRMAGYLLTEMDRHASRWNL